MKANTTTGPRRILDYALALAVGLTASGGLIGPAEGADAFVPLKPQARVLDTREPGDITLGDPLDGPETLLLELAGVARIPLDATAVQLNVTVTEGTGTSFLSVWDEGGWPGTSSLNWSDGDARPNAVTTSIASDGFIRIYNNAGLVHVIVDVVGYYTAGLGDFEVVSDSFPLALNPGDLSGSTVSCPQGKGITGGGASIVENAGLDLKTSIPRSDLTGWSATAIGEDPPGTGTLNIYAVCAQGVLPSPAM
ncbi:MAG: hypothetical protein U9Q81_15295 [Pseudomonadota bacterium]|nr:hypothetical protein [Pseudomonadota bacterium]